MRVRKKRLRPVLSDLTEHRADVMFCYITEVFFRKEEGRFTVGDLDCDSKYAGEKLCQVMVEPQDNYQLEAKRFARYMTEHGIADLREGFTAYAAELGSKLHAREISTNYHNKLLSAAKNRIRYALQRLTTKFDLTQKYELEQLLKKIRLKKVKTTAVHNSRILSFDEIRSLVEGTTEEALPGGRAVSLMIEFLSYTAVRVSEMLAIRRSDLTDHQNRFEVRIIGRSRKERRVFVDTDLIERIMRHFEGTNWLFEHSGKPYNRIYVTNQIRLAGVMILSKKISAHTLRHSFAKAAVKAGKSLKAVSSYLGHSSVSITASLYEPDELSDADVRALWE